MTAPAPGPFSSFILPPSSFTMIRILLFTAVGLTLAEPALADDAARPNIILIFVDDK